MRPASKCPSIVGGVLQSDIFVGAVDGVKAEPGLRQAWGRKPRRGMAKSPSADYLILLVSGIEPGRWRLQMAREVIRQSKAVPATSLLALALGAAAFGAVAVGALAIGRLAIGRLSIKKARFGAIEVDELTVRKLRVVEHDGPRA